MVRIETSQFPLPIQPLRNGQAQEVSPESAPVAPPAEEQAAESRPATPPPAQEIEFPVDDVVIGGQRQRVLASPAWPNTEGPSAVDLLNADSTDVVDLGRRPEDARAEVDAAEHPPIFYGLRHLQRDMQPALRARPRVGTGVDITTEYDDPPRHDAGESPSAAVEDMPGSHDPVRFVAEQVDIALAPSFAPNHQPQVAADQAEEAEVPVSAYHFSAGQQFEIQEAYRKLSEDLNRPDLRTPR